MKWVFLPTANSWLNLEQIARIDGMVIVSERDPHLNGKALKLIFVGQPESHGLVVKDQIDQSAILNFLTAKPAMEKPRGEAPQETNLSAPQENKKAKV